MQSITTDDDSEDEQETLLQDCMDLLQAPVQSSLQPVHRIPAITSTPVLSSSSPALTHSDLTPLLPRKQPVQFSTPLSTMNINCTPTTSWQPAGARQLQLSQPSHPRPEIGGKCPRRRQLELLNDNYDPECASCKKLKEENEQLRSQLAAYQLSNGKNIYHINIKYILYLNFFSYN